MNKTKWLKVVNPFLVLAFLAQLTTAVIMVLGIRSKINFLIHKNNGLVFLGLIIIHLCLNWSWIKTNFFEGRTVSGR